MNKSKASGALLALLVIGCAPADMAGGTPERPNLESSKICGTELSDVASLAAKLRSLPGARNLAPPDKQFEVFQFSPNRDPVWIITKPGVADYPTVACIQNAYDASGRPKPQTFCAGSEQSCKALLAPFSVQSQVIRVPAAKMTGQDDQPQ